MTQINPYLTFNGHCEAAFELYKSVFGGEYSDFNRFSDLPPTEGQEMSAEDLDKIMHVELSVSNGTKLYGSDTNAQHGAVTFGQNVSLSINTESRAEADRIFSSLAKGGTVTMPITDTFWGAYFGMLQDQFGILWLINYDEPK